MARRCSGMKMFSGWVGSYHPEPKLGSSARKKMMLVRRYAVSPLVFFGHLSLGVSV
jgi:hypothetical protein